jgi:hypothetical protein
MLASHESAVGFDRYDRNARLMPALLVMLPALLLVAVWSKPLWTLMGGVAALLVTCGATYLASHVARHRGRIVERRLIATDGALPSVRALRHRDALIDPQTKARYHDFLRSHGLHVPDSAEERLSPKVADDAYSSACKLLLELTRDKSKFPLVASENIGYGFRRNSLGMRSMALIMLGLVLAANSALLVADYLETQTIEWAGVALTVFMLGYLYVWLFIVNLDFVRDAGNAYAVRLLATCETLAREV